MYGRDSGPGADRGMVRVALATGKWHFRRCGPQLGVETQCRLSHRAIARTTPFLMRLFSWVALATHFLQKRHPLTHGQAARHGMPCRAILRQYHRLGAPPPVDYFGGFFTVATAPQRSKSPRSTVRPDSRFLGLPCLSVENPAEKLSQNALGEARLRKKQGTGSPKSHFHGNTRRLAVGFKYLLLLRAKNGHGMIADDVSVASRPSATSPRKPTFLQREMDGDSSSYAQRDGASSVKFDD